MIKFSVLVVTYNCTEQQLTYTLDSIISQDLDSFEIIVCDDGSKDNHEDFLKAYFRSQKFESYCLVLNKENKGTVKNLLSGLANAHGKYTKMIGAGDALSNEEVLSKVYQSMETENSLFAFSNMKPFVFNKGERKEVNRLRVPFVKSAEAGNIAFLKENIIVFADHISGARMFFETEYIKSMLLKIQDMVIYVEDLLQYWVLLNGDRFSFVEINGISYELGTGISTIMSSANVSRIKKDTDNFLMCLFSVYPDDVYVIRRKRLCEIESRYNNSLSRIIVKSIIEPKWTALMLKKAMCRLFGWYIR